MAVHARARQANYRPTFVFSELQLPPAEVPERGLKEFCYMF